MDPAPEPGPGADLGLPSLGVSTHLTWRDYTDAERLQVLDRLQALGVRWIRIDLYWGWLEPIPGARTPWVVHVMNVVVDAARARGMQVLVSLGSTPAWAGSSSATGPPDEPATYAEIAGWAARRFAGRVAAWGIYNSPNQHGWTAATYARVLDTAYPAIKSADPASLVVAGNVGGNDDAWVRGVYAAGAGGSFDVLATHPYQAPRDLPPEAPDDGSRSRIAHVRAVRAVMLEYGDADTPIWFSEFGWSSHPNHGTEPPWARGVTPEQQADYAVRTFGYVAEDFPYVTNLFWYNDRDKAVGSVQEDNYGLLHRDLSPKPVYRALAEVFASQRATTQAGSRTLVISSGGAAC
jgi:hypothetical protein